MRHLGCCGRCLQEDLWDVRKVDYGVESGGAAVVPIPFHAHRPLLFPYAASYHMLYLCGACLA